MSEWFDRFGRAVERLGGGVLSALGALADWSSSPAADFVYKGAGVPVPQQKRLFGNEQGGYDFPWGTYTPSDVAYGAKDVGKFVPLFGAPVPQDATDADIDWLLKQASIPADLESDVLASAILYVTGQTGHDWSKAWDVTHNAATTDQISPAQALIAPMFGGKNAIQDRAELNGSPLYNFATGLTDAANTIFLDPLVLGGKAVKAAKEVTALRPLQTKGVAQKVASKVLGTGYAPGRPKTVQVEYYQYSKSWSKFKDFVKTHDIGEISALMPNNEYRDQISAAMKMAKDDKEMDYVGKIALGDPEAIKKLTDSNDGLAASIALLNTEYDTLRHATATPLNRKYIQTRMNMIKVALNDKHDVADWHDRLMNLGQTLDVSTPGGYRLFGKDWLTGYRFEKAVGRNAKSLQRNYTSWLQGTYDTGNPLTPVVRMMRPGTATTGWMDLNRADGDVHELSNMLNLTSLNVATKTKLVEDYKQQFTTRTREASALKAEKQAVASIAVARGYSPTAVDGIVQNYLMAKGEANRVLKESQYSSAGFKGHTADVMMVDGVPTHLPLHPSQTTDVVRLTDISQLDEILKRESIKNGLHNAILLGQDHIQAAGDLLSSFWKASVLLRIGFPIRVFTDDQARILSKLGALAFSKMWLGSSGNLLQNSFRTTILRAVKGKEATPFRPYGSGMFPKGLGGRLEDAWGTAYKQNIHYGQSGSGSFFESQIDVHGKAIYEELSKKGRYKTLSHNDVGYHEAWLKSINDILMNNSIVRMVLKGKTDTEIVGFLKGGSPGARKLRKQIPHFANAPKDWAERVRADVENTMLTRLTPDIKDKALNKTLTLKDLQDIPLQMKPFINGEAIEHNIGGGLWNKTYTKVINKLYKGLGQMPTDVLSRHPYFVTNYRARIQKLAKDIVEVYPEDQVPEWYMRHMEFQAREYALKQTKNLLFDISSHSNIAHSMRFISPFFSAWQDSFNTWLGLARKDPSLFPRSLSIWNTPNKVGEYQRDENGNVITDINGRPKVKSYWGFTIEVTDKDGKPVEDNKMWFLDPEQQIRLQLPEYLGKSITGGMTVDISKGSLFSIAQGDTPWLPGGGPLVNVAAGALLQNKPELEDSLHFLLPYGAPKNLLDTVLPASFKNTYQAVFGDSDDQAFAQTQFMIMQSEMVKYQQGDRPNPPSWPEIKQRASAMWKLKVASSLLLPFAPSYKSPYQWYIDQYHKYQRMADPNSPTRLIDNPDEEFYNNFGDTLYILTSSLTKNVTGIPATKNAYELTKKYADIISGDPELGRMIVGPAGQGDFSSSIYRWQFDNEVTEGSGIHFREKQTPSAALEDAQRKVGWIKYRQFVNGMTAKMNFDGYTSFTDPGAEEYAAARDQYVEALASDNPVWGEDYTTTNRNSMQTRIATFEKLVKEPTLINDHMRQDITALADYLQVRRKFVAELQSRAEEGSKTTLDAKKNEDLKEAWQQFQSRMIGVNTMFSDLFHTYLEFDGLQY